MDDEILAKELLQVYLSNIAYYSKSESYNSNAYTDPIMGFLSDYEKVLKRLKGERPRTQQPGNF